jgi:KaiC/GvpD/RAD55 family RecA-like ATPase
MNQFPYYIQKAVDLGLLEVEDEKICGCNKDAVETVIGLARIIDKLQPTTAAQIEDTVDQESIVLTRILCSPSGLARELWSQLRTGFGVGHGQSIPSTLWSNNVFRAIGKEVDETFLGQRNASLISRESLINQYEQLNPASRLVSILEFNQVITQLADQEMMKSYGDKDSEWATALDILRQVRVRSLYQETIHIASQAAKADNKIEKNLEFLQSKSMECIGMLRGAIGNQGNAISISEAIIGDPNGRDNWIARMREGTALIPPVSTGVGGIDIDMEGGVKRDDPKRGNGGRLYTLAARTGVGKTIIGTHIAAKLASQGLTVGFVSAELDASSIEARILAALMVDLNCDYKALVGQLESPSVSNKDQISESLIQVVSRLEDQGGKFFVEAPWGACVDSAINSMRAMKAKSPELRCVVLDHFHALARHKAAPAGESSMLEERAYKLMTAAKELDIDLFVLAQMNRIGMDSISRKQPPQLNEIRGTDALAHVSHAVWLVRRPEAEADGQKADKKVLELWHGKTRGRQAFWCGNGYHSFDEYVDKSILYMDYGHSKIATDDTMRDIMLFSRKGRT